MKLKFIKTLDATDVPDHIIQEIDELSEEFLKLLLPVVKENNPSIVLTSLNLVYASIIKFLVVNDAEEIEKAAKLCGVSLIKNVENKCDFKFQIFKDKSQE